MIIHRQSTLIGKISISIIDHRHLWRPVVSSLSIDLWRRPRILLNIWTGITNFGSIFEISGYENNKLSLLRVGLKRRRFLQTPWHRFHFVYKTVTFFYFYFSTKFSFVKVILNEVPHSGPFLLRVNMNRYGLTSLGTVVLG